jgi:signal transduction histidine kinase
MAAIRRLVGWCKAHPFVTDSLLAAVILAVSIPELWRYEGHADDALYREPNVFGLVLIVLGAAPLAWRRIHPLAVLVITSTAIVTYESLGFPSLSLSFGVLVALYTAATLLDRRQSAIACLVVAVGVMIVLLTARWEVNVGSIISNVVIFGTVWLIGDNVGTRRELLASLRERARQAEENRDEEARRAVAEERARIARELHDVVAHHMSVMIVQAGAARRILPSDPDRAAEVLTSVESTGREAMNEMRRMLGVLRSDDEDAAGMTPQPSVVDLSELVAHCAEAGLEVSLDVEGEPTDVPPGVGLSAYRIVQEALTNTLKHAGPATASVRVTYRPDRLDVEVCDDGRGASAGSAARSTGHGLVGMRERVDVFGGELTTGPRPGGGFAVRAQLPLESAVS